MYYLFYYLECTIDTLCLKIGSATLNRQNKQHSRVRNYWYNFGVKCSDVHVGRTATREAEVAILFAGTAELSYFWNLYLTWICLCPIETFPFFILCHSGGALECIKNLSPWHLVQVPLLSVQVPLWSAQVPFWLSQMSLCLAQVPLWCRPLRAKWTLHQRGAPFEFSALHLKSLW